MTSQPALFVPASDLADLQDELADAYEVIRQIDRELWRLDIRRHREVNARVEAERDLELAIREVQIQRREIIRLEEGRPQ